MASYIHQETMVVDVTNYVNVFVEALVEEPKRWAFVSVDLFGSVWCSAPLT